MNEPLKQRLVGAAVLLGLAVIFLPPLINRSGSTQKAVGITIPAQPKIEVRSHLHVLKLPAPIVADELEKEPASALVKPKVKKVDADLPAWIVQLASFKNKTNAYKLRDKLRKKKYDAFVQRVEINNSVLYRVRVGPELKRELAEQIRRRLQDETQLKGIVKKHSRS